MICWRVGPLGAGVVASPLTSQLLHIWMGVVLTDDRTAEQVFQHVDRDVEAHLELGLEHRGARPRQLGSRLADAGYAYAGPIRGATRIKEGLQDKLFMGNLDAKRDWGFAGDYVEMMWLMLQQDEPDDYVVATGETHSVQEFAELAFAIARLNYGDHIMMDDSLFRPAEVNLLLGDCSKAKARLGWKHRIGFEDLVREMRAPLLHRREARPDPRELARRLGPLAPSPSGDLDRDPIALLLAALAVALSVGYSAAQISYDATSLYFSDAKLSALTHSIGYFIQDPFVASIFLAGINYAAIIQVFGDQAARLYSWASGLAIIALALATAEALEVPKRARMILLGMIVSSTAIFDLLGDGKIDLAATAPALAAVYWILRRPAGTRREHLLIGFLAGMAMAARPFNILLMPTIILFVILQDTMFATEAPPGKRFSNLFGAAIWIAIGASPWLAYILVTNWIIVGDPIAFIKSFLRLQSGAYPLSFPADRVWANRLLYPFSITYINHGQSLGNISPLFLGLLPLGLWGPIRRRTGLSKRLRLAIFAAVGTLLVWLVVSSMVFEIRYIIFLWVLLFMPVAVWAAAALEAPDALMQALVRPAVVTMLLFVIVRTVYVSLDTYSPVDRHGNAHCYYFEKCAIVQTVNQIAQPGERLLMLNAFRYYLRQDLFACSTGSTEYQSLQRLSRTDSLRFWTEAYREGNTLLVFQEDYVLGHLYLGMLPSPVNAPPWLHLEPIAGKPGDELVIYRMTATNPPVRIEKRCVNTPDGWLVQPAVGFGD